MLSQRVPPAKQTGNALAYTLSAIEHLGYIQIDTISAIQRAHHHTLWNRNPSYLSSQLDELMVNKRIFEYWSHATAYLPMQDFRYSLPRKQAIANGNESGEWSSKPSKRALEYLFMQGELMVPYRVNFHKVYDLTERVLPEDTDTSLPNPQEYARFLITRYLQANGLGQAAEISYLLKNTKALVSDTLQEMASNGELLQIKVSGNNYFALSAHPAQAHTGPLRL